MREECLICFWHCIYCLSYCPWFRKQKLLLCHTITQVGFYLDVLNFHTLLLHVKKIHELSKSLFTTKAKLSNLKFIKSFAVHKLLNAVCEQYSWTWKSLLSKFMNCFAVYELVIWSNKNESLCSILLLLDSVKLYNLFTVSPLKS